MVWTVPRSWSLWGRCSGRSGGTFLTSNFFSTGQSSQAFYFLSQNIKNTRREQRRRQRFDCTCGVFSWRRAGRRRFLWSLRTQTDAETHQECVRSLRLSQLLTSQQTDNSLCCVLALNSPLSPLLAAWQSCLGRRLAVLRSPPSTSRRLHTPEQRSHSRVFAARFMMYFVCAWMQIVFSSKSNVANVREWSHTHKHKPVYLRDDVDDLSLFDRQLVFILCFIRKEDFTLLPPCQTHSDQIKLWSKDTSK